MQNLPNQPIKSTQSTSQKHQYQNQQLVVVQLNNSTKKIAKIIRTNLSKDKDKDKNDKNKEIQYLDDNKKEILEQMNIMPCTQTELPLKKFQILVKTYKQAKQQINENKEIVEKKNIKNNDIDKQIIIISDDSSNKLKHKIISKDNNKYQNKNNKQHKHKNKQKSKHKIIHKNNDSVLLQEHNKLSQTNSKPLQQKKQKLQKQVISIKQNNKKQQNQQIKQKVEIQQKVSKNQKIHQTDSTPSSILFPYNYQNDPTFNLDNLGVNFMPMPYISQTNYPPYPLFTYTNQFIPNFNPFYITFYQNSNSTTFPTYQLQNFKNPQLVFKFKEILHSKNLEQKEIDIILNKTMENFNGNPQNLSQILKEFQLMSKDEIVNKYLS